MANRGSQADGGAERRERGMATWFVGVAFLVADLLLIFFAPAALRTGRHTGFLAVIAVLAAIGCSLMIWGRIQARRAA
jgi:Na+/melibiose symporter-like transporter